MKRLVLFLLFAAAVSALAYPEFGQIQNVAGAMWGWDDTAKVWRPMPSSTSAEMTGTFTLRLPSIASAIELKTSLGTGTVTTLHSIASWTSGSLIVWQPRVKSYYLIYNVGSSTPSAAELVANGRLMEAGDLERQFHLRNTADAAFVADPAGVGTLSVGIYLEQ